MKQDQPPLSDRRVQWLISRSITLWKKRGRRRHYPELTRVLVSLDTWFRWALGRDLDGHRRTLREFALCALMDMAEFFPDEEEATL